MGVEGALSVLFLFTSQVNHIGGYNEDIGGYNQDNGTAHTKSINIYHTPKPLVVIGHQYCNQYLNLHLNLNGILKRRERNCSGRMHRVH